MTNAQCEKQTWCGLAPGHDGASKEAWVKRMEDKDKSFNNYRGRRYYACTALGDLEKAIERLGVEDGSVLPIPGREFNTRPSDQIIAELKNQATTLLRMVLILNDGQVSASKLNGF
jgi:hypothetical protein